MKVGYCPPASPEAEFLTMKRAFPNELPQYAIK